MPNTMPLSTLQALTVHPAADAFPYISDDEVLNLAQDIEANGLVHPVILFENEILDGRNRLRALAKTNIIEIPVTEYEGDDPVGYVLSLNVHRRHLSTHDWVEVAYKLKAPVADRARERQLGSLAQNASPISPSGSVDPDGEAGRTRELVAEALQGAVSESTLKKGWRVMESAPEAWEDAKRTGTGIATAYAKLIGKAGPGATAGDKAKPEPKPEYGFESGADTGWGREESTYEQKRSTAVEALIRTAEHLAMQISRYALTDGDVADATEVLSSETASILAEFFSACEA